MIETDKFGRAVAPHHDGSLDGVLVLDAGQCVLLYRSTDGVRRVVTLSGVHQLDVSRLRQGNIINGIMVHPAQDGLSKGYDALLRRLGWGSIPPLKGRFLFVLDSSYGAEVIADCDDVELEVREETTLSW